MRSDDYNKYLAAIKAANDISDYDLSVKMLRQIYAQYAVISMQVGELTDIGRTFGNENYRRVVKYICDVLKLQLGNDELLARTGEDTF